MSPLRDALSSLGMATPFEIYYGREPNRVKFRLSLAERKHLEVPKEDEPNLQELSTVKKSKLQECLSRAKG